MDFLTQLHLQKTWNVSPSNFVFNANCDPLRNSYKLTKTIQKQTGILPHDHNPFIKIYKVRCKKISIMLTACQGWESLLYANQG